MVLFLLVIVGLVVAGLALMFRQSRWQVLAAAAAAVPTLLLLTVRDGRLRGTRDQGLCAIVIDAGIVVRALVLHGPKVTGQRCGAQQGH